MKYCLTFKQSIVFIIDHAWIKKVKNHVNCKKYFLTSYENKLKKNMFVKMDTCK